MIQQNDEKIDDVDEDFEELESEFDEEEMLRMERENDQFSLWLRSYFLPIMLRICTILFALLAVVQVVIRFPKLIPWLFGGMIGSGATILALWAYATILVIEHRKKRRLYEQTH